MNILQALVLSIIEGITEFLPVSSTGHLILTRSLLHISNTAFTQGFILIVQLGAIGSVVQMYWKTLTDRRYWLPLLVAFMPTIVGGFFLYDFIKSLFGNENFIALMLFCGGVVLLFIDRIIKKQTRPLSLKIALVVGITQIFSFVPGVSRAAATIIGGMASGLSKKKAVEFSFLLAVPTLVAAVILDLKKSPISTTGNDLGLLAIGFVGAFVTARIAIRWFISYVSTRSFAIFGVWRISLAVLFWLLTNQ